MQSTPLAVTLFLEDDAQHQPWLLQGLQGLAHRGTISLKVRPRLPRWRDRMTFHNFQPERVRRPYPCSARLRLSDPQRGLRVLLAVDLQDWHDVFSRTCLRTCAIVFKRSFQRDLARFVEADFSSRILPAGLTHPCPASPRNYPGPYLVSQISLKLESLFNRPGILLPRLRTWTQALAGPPDPPAAPLPPHAVALPPEGFVLYQPSYWEWGEDTEAERLNHARAEMLRGLRARLGSRFLGGMFFKGTPPDQFADCRATLPTRREDYLKLVQQAAVVISTNGFGQSIPWKVAEYLSLGKCILSEPLAMELPEPLVPDQHLVCFRDLDDCAAQCRRLLGDPATVQRLGAAASQYYQQHGRPEAAVWRMLNTALAQVAERSPGPKGGHLDSSPRV